MSGHVVILHGKASRERACKLAVSAPSGSVLTVKAPRRSTDQNALMWSLLSQVSMQKPGGRTLTPDVWKALFMSAAGHAVQFETGLDGAPFPLGFRSSKLSKEQMSDLLEFIKNWAAENGVQFKEDGDA